MQRFTAIPSKALSDHARIKNQCLSFEKLIFLNCGFSKKVTCAFPLQEKTHLRQEKRQFLPQY